MSSIKELRERRKSWWRDIDYHVEKLIQLSKELGQSDSRADMRSTLIQLTRITNAVKPEEFENKNSE